jgi:hypothetical protein
VAFAGRYETVTGVGIAPRPVQRPIPLWMGGSSPAAYERIGRLADGWFPLVPPDSRMDEARAIIERSAVAAGRDATKIGLEGRVTLGPGGVEKLLSHVGRLVEVGATHVTVNTMKGGLASVDDHLRVLEQISDGLALRSRRSRCPSLLMRAETGGRDKGEPWNR